MKKSEKIVKLDKKVKKDKIVKENKKVKKEKIIKSNADDLKNKNVQIANDDLIIAKDHNEIKSNQNEIKLNQNEIKSNQNEENLKPNESNSPEINYKDEKKHKTKRLFFGLGKEFWRISWPTNKKILNDFITTVIVMIFFTLIFYGVGVLIGSFIK